jgi:hypothetical protein
MEGVAKISLTSTEHIVVKAGAFQGACGPDQC